MGNWVLRVWAVVLSSSLGDKDLPQFWWKVTVLHAHMVMPDLVVVL